MSHQLVGTSITNLIHTCNTDADGHDSTLGVGVLNSGTPNSLAQCVCDNGRACLVGVGQHDGKLFAAVSGNMKMTLNGALTIGTLDGANIEIREEVGEDNIFIFGKTAGEIQELFQRGYNPWDYYYANAELMQVLDMIGNGYFSMDEPLRFRPLFDELLHNGDRYALLADYASYMEAQDAVDRLYLDQAAWARKAMLNVARSGHFSSDRTIGEYASLIWDVVPVLPTRDEPTA